MNTGAEDILNIRDSILNAGVALLREKGIAALSQPKIAAAAGVKQSHLTYYFPTRADLLLNIAGRTIETMTANLEAQLEEKTRDAALAETVAKHVIEGIPPRVIIGLIVATDEDPEIRKPLRKLIKGVRKRIQALLAKAGLDNSEEAALLFHATIVGLAVMHQARLDRNSAREVTDGVAGILRLLAPENKGTQ